MKTYEISKDYELLADLLESGAVIVKRFGGKPWTQFPSHKAGKIHQLSRTRTRLVHLTLPGAELGIHRPDRRYAGAGDAQTATRNDDHRRVGETPRHRTHRTVHRIRMRNIQSTQGRIDVRWTDGSTSNAMAAEAFGAMRLKWWIFSTAPVQLKANPARWRRKPILYFESR